MKRSLTRLFDALFTNCTVPLHSTEGGTQLGEFGVT
jgi:hypothetical protein